MGRVRRLGGERKLVGVRSYSGIVRMGEMGRLG